MLDEDAAADLLRYGVVPSQIVDLARDDDPRILRYLDLLGDAHAPPLVVESDGEPRLHILRSTAGVDHRGLAERWGLRSAIRGDEAWIGILEPGRLRIYQPQIIRSRIRVTEVGDEFELGHLIPRLLYDVPNEGLDFSIRAYLVRLLGQSIDSAITTHGIDADDALSLVGRGLFWRFLVDRNLLAGVDPGEVCLGASTWEACLDSKSRALRTFEWLDKTFNGGLLPFRHSPKRYPAAVFESVLGNIAHGATETGQLRLPTDWAEINFAHVPVGLLSEIYEAFSHTRQPQKAKASSIHYTPRRIAEFVVREALDSMDGIERPRVLDPAVGAGVFLVAAFRQLAEREWERTKVRPRRPALRRILCTQLHGLDIDSRALRLAELALYLRALELDPDPRPPSALRFDRPLRGRTLLLLPQPEGSLGSVTKRFAGKFDLVVGNPPWTAKAQAESKTSTDSPDNATSDPLTGDKTNWVRHSQATVAARLGKRRAEAFDLPDTNPDLPFVWRAMEWAKHGGRIAFVLHARWLFGTSSKAQNARRDLLEALHFTGILNGSDLRKTSVWPNTDAPFCVVFGINELPPPHAAFAFISPRLETTQETKQTRMRVDWNDARPITVREIVNAPWILKSRFRGNRIAERTLRRMMDIGEPIQTFLMEFDTKFRNGYQLGGEARIDKRVSAEELQGLPDLRQGSWSDLGFVVDTTLLPHFDLPKILHTREIESYRAPLLLLRKAVPADPTVARTHRVDSDLAYHESFHGVSFSGVGAQGRAIRDYLQILLQSSLYLFHQLLTDPQYGVWVDAVYLDSVKRLPVVPFAKLSATLQQRSRLLSEKLIGAPTESLQDAIDRFAFEVYDLHEIDGDAVRDIVATALPSTEAKQRALQPTRDHERADFVATSRMSLEHVYAASSTSIMVHERAELSIPPWRMLEFRIGDAGTADSCTEFSLTRFLEIADEKGVSQVIFQTDPHVAIVGLVDRYTFWTKTQARLLANDLIEVMAGDHDD